MTALIAGNRISEPSRFVRKLNGDVDHINGYDDDGFMGEPRAAYKDMPDTKATGDIELEIAEINLK